MSNERFESGENQDGGVKPTLQPLATVFSAAREPAVKMPAVEKRVSSWAEASTASWKVWWQESQVAEKQAACWAERWTAPSQV